jgi:hypothetical protein
MHADADEGIGVAGDREYLLDLGQLRREIDDQLQVEVPGKSQLSDRLKAGPDPGVIDPDRVAGDHAERLHPLDSPLDRRNGQV